MGRALTHVRRANGDRAARRAHLRNTSGRIIHVSMPSIEEITRVAASALRG
jgi:hypothetical protein